MTDPLREGAGARTTGPLRVGGGARGTKASAG